VLAAQGITLIATVSFGVALLVASLAIGVVLTIVDGVTSGDWAFLARELRRKLRPQRAGPSGTLGAVTLDAGPLGERALMFTTNTEQRRFVKTDCQPIGIRFESPVEQEVSSAQLPCKIKRAGMTIFRLDQFLGDGIVISDQRPGIDVRAEVSYGKAR
jgi:hypothetical protein